MNSINWNKHSQNPNKITHKTRKTKNSALLSVKCQHCHSTLSSFITPKLDVAAVNHCLLRSSYILRNDFYQNQIISSILDKQILAWNTTFEKNQISHPWTRNIRTWIPYFHNKNHHKLAPSTGQFAENHRQTHEAYLRKHKHTLRTK